MAVGRAGALLGALLRVAGGLVGAEVGDGDGMDGDGMGEALVVVGVVTGVGVLVAPGLGAPEPEVQPATTRRAATASATVADPREGISER
ncbi:hypothetical protein GCM10009738_71220 [Kitasatospora viridis]